jgi:ribonuclease D
VGHAFLEPAHLQASLNHVLDKYAAGQQNELKRYMKVAWDDDKDYWRRRPLTKEGLDYAANDVRFLLQAFDVMAHKLEQQGLFDQALSMSRARVDHARASTPWEPTPQRALTSGS